MMELWQTVVKLGPMIATFLLGFYCGGLLFAILAMSRGRGAQPS